jgi:hypothetical protein
MPSTKKRSFLDLPGEIRNKIYKLLLAKQDHEDTAGVTSCVEPKRFLANQVCGDLNDGSERLGTHPAILRSCKRCLEEGSPVLYETKAFVVDDSINATISPPDQLLPNISPRYLRPVKMVIHEAWIWPLDQNIRQVEKILRELPALQMYSLEVDPLGYAPSGETHDFTSIMSDFTNQLKSMAAQTLPSHPTLSKLYQEVAQHQVWNRFTGGSTVDDGPRYYYFVPRTSILEDNEAWNVHGVGHSLPTTSR